MQDANDSHILQYCISFHEIVCFIIENVGLFKLT